MKSNLYYILSSVCLIGVCFSSSDSKDERVFEKPIRRVQMEIDEGSIKVIGQGDGVTKVSSSPERSTCRHEISVEDDVLKVTNSKKSGGCRCDYTLLLPKEVELSINAGAGEEVEIMNISAAVKLHLGGGRVSLKNVSGDTNVDLGAGGVSFSATETPSKKASLSVNVGSGSIDIGLPKGAKVFYSGGHTGSFMNQFSSTVPESSFDVCDYVLKLTTGMGSTKVKNVDDSYSKY